MKKFLRMFVSGILGFFAFSFIMAGIFAKISGTLIVGVVIALIAVKVSGKLPSDKRKAQEKLEGEQLLKDAGHLETVVLTHEAGLPIPNGILCTIHYYKDNIKIEGSRATFNLSVDKIIDISVKTNTEIETFYNSSIGGAVGGALILGPLGAMIGGRKKKKEIKKTENFLVITYDKDDQINFLVFNTERAPFKVNKIIKIFKDSGIKYEKTIEL